MGHKRLKSGGRKKTDLPKEVIDMMDEGLDELMDLLAGEESDLFDSPGERAGHFFSEYHKYRKHMNRPRQCVFPGCEKRSITASHTLQRSSTLQFIAEDQHVLTPRIDIKSGRLLMKRIGIGEASTFPGFCADHENIFAEFESAGELCKDEHVALQVFRTICREITIQEIQLKSMQNSLLAYDQIISEKGLGLLKEKFGEDLLKKHNINLSKFSSKGISKRQEGRKWAIHRVEETISLLREEFLLRSFADIKSSGEGLYYIVIKTQDTLPVSLSGMCNFHVEDEGIPHHARAILNVIPTTRQTIISITALLRHENYIKFCLSHFSKLLGPLSMIETWMVNGSDHWFITPSEWQNIPDLRKEVILSDILDDTHSICEPYPRSILDSVRKRMLDLSDAKSFPQNEYDAEMAKISYPE